MSSEVTKTSQLLGGLSHPIRCHILRIIDDHNGAISVERLADRVRETVSALQQAEMGSSIRIALQHQHLPDLADRNIITYQRTVNQVRPGPQFAATLYMLDAVTT